MEKIKKVFNAKVISLLLPCLFLFNSTAYPIDLAQKTYLRVPLLSKSQNTQIREKDASDRYKNIKFYYERSLKRKDIGDLLGEVADLFKARQYGLREVREEDIILKLAAAITGVRLFQYPSFKKWFLLGLVERTGMEDAKIFLMEILDEEGQLKKEQKQKVEELFNALIISYPTIPPNPIDITSSLNRYPGEFKFFQEYVVSNIITRKIRKGEKSIKIKVIGAATGEEMASIYFYLKNAFDSHPEWGSMEEWEIEIHSIDIFKYCVNKAMNRLFNKPDRLVVGVSTGAYNIIDLLRELPSEKRKQIFKVTKGNIVYKPHRDSFLEGADVIFANTTTHHILSSVREATLMDILDSGAVILTTALGFYEAAIKKRNPIEIPGKDYRGKNYYYIPQPEEIFIQEGIEKPPLSEEYEQVALFDDPGEFLPTHLFFNSIAAHEDYNRLKHVEALAQAIKTGNAKLTPSNIKGLNYIISRDGIKEEYKQYARMLLDAMNLLEKHASTQSRLASNGAASEVFKEAKAVLPGEVVDDKQTGDLHAYFGIENINISDVYVAVSVRYLVHNPDGAIVAKVENYEIPKAELLEKDSVRISDPIEIRNRIFSWIDEQCTQKIEELNRQGMLVTDSTRLVTYRDIDNQERRTIYKPAGQIIQNAGDAMQTELLVSELLRELGYDTCLITRREGFGWINFIEHFPLTQLMSIGLDKSLVSLDRVREFGRWMAVEYLINNLDVHEENFLIKEEGIIGKDFLIIDHDNVFLPIKVSIEDFINRCPEVAILAFGRPLRGESLEPIHKAFWDGFIQGARELQGKQDVIGNFFERLSSSSEKGLVVRRIIRDTYEYIGKAVPYYSVLVTISEMRSAMEGRMANLRAVAEGRLYPVFLDSHYFHLQSDKPRNKLDAPPISPTINIDTDARRTL